ncbi:uncharacterized protein LOC142326467 [Lycorma delicatula]|uniref:uncharacterized protein LOC142326467 n=1 Tax=Lycorma delicatula TaxID=130591 RepID=UPI003F50F987
MRSLVIYFFILAVALAEVKKVKKEIVDDVEVDDKSDLEASHSYASGYGGYYGGGYPTYTYGNYGGWNHYPHYPIGAISYSNRYQEHAPVYKPVVYKWKSPYYYGHYLPHYGHYGYY